MRKKALHYIKLPTARHWALAIKFVASAIIILVVFMLFSLSSKTNNIAAQSKDLAAQSKKVSEQNTAERQAGQQRLENDMACIGTFFSLENRQFYKITDLRHCTITNIQTGVASPLIPNFGQSSTQSTPTQTTPSSGQSSTPTSPTTPAPIKQPTTQPQQGVVQRVGTDVKNTINNVLDFVGL